MASSRKVGPCLVLTLLLLVLLGERGFCQESPAVAHAFKIGVVDVSRVFDGYKKRDDLNVRLEEFRRQKAQDIETLRAEVGRLGDKIQLLVSGTDERKTVEQELSKKRVELEAARQVAAEEVEKKYRDFLVEVYKDISDAARLYGEAQGYDLILKTETLDMETDSTPDLQLLLSTQKILYYSPSLDITEILIQNLNTKYEASKPEDAP